MGTLPLGSVFGSLPCFGAAALAARVLYRDLSRRGWGRDVIMNHSTPTKSAAAPTAAA